LRHGLGLTRRIETDWARRRAGHIISVHVPHGGCTFARENRRMNRVCYLFILIASSLALAGCTQPRAVHLVKADGDRAFENRHYDAASVYYGEVVERRPGDWQAQYRYGLTMLELDRPHDARRALEIAAAHQPRDRTIRSALARAMYDQGATNDLFAYLRQEAQQSRDPNAYVDLAR